MTTDMIGAEVAMDTDEGEDVAVVSLAGPLDIYTVPEVRGEVEGLLAGGGGIVIDLTAVTLIDSAGLGLLLSVRNRSVREGLGPLGLVCPHRRLRHVFEITGLRQSFVFGRDIAAVREALAAPPPHGSR